MPKNFYIARQPIVTLQNEIFGYELLFREINSEGKIEPNFKDELLATAKVVVNALNHFGIASLTDNNLAFINIDEELLLDSLIFNIPKKYFVLEILEDTKITKKSIKRIKELKEFGYKLAIDDVHCGDGFIERFTPIFEYIDFLKLDVSLIKDDNIDNYLKLFKNYDFTLLAEKVETKEEYERYKSYGCTLFQGYFFAKPDIITRKSFEPKYKKLFQLINMLDNESVEVEDIVEQLEEEVGLTVQLLRYINSCNIGTKKEIKSVKQAINLLGRKPLKQWLLLIAFSKSETNANTNPNKNPILQLAITRAKIMSELAKRIPDIEDYHEASFTGILSLVDIILKIPMEEIFKEINVDESIQKAIQEHTGILGNLLSLIIEIERFNIQNATKILKKLHISHSELSEILDRSYTI